MSNCDRRLQVPVLVALVDQAPLGGSNHPLHAYQLATDATRQVR